VLWDIEHDRDAESSSSLIAGAEDALTVGHDDDIDLGTRAAPARVRESNRADSK
jgi:hypothetical protein